MVTINAADGYRHLTKLAKILQIVGVTMTGTGGTAALRGGVILQNAGTQGWSLYLKVQLCHVQMLMMTSPPLLT